MNINVCVLSGRLTKAVELRATAYVLDEEGKRNGILEEAPQA